MTLDEFRESTDSRLFYRLSPGTIEVMLEDAIQRVEDAEDLIKAMREGDNRWRYCNNYWADRLESALNKKTDGGE